MELITKSLATASTSSPAQGAFNTERLMDRFSNLQEEMVHHILSCLTQRDLARVGCVSNRCRQFQLSTPSLNFDAMPYAHFTLGRLRLLNYLDRYLIQRGNNHIQRFRICWVFTGLLVGNCEEYFRVITWIHNAARCNVEVLDLDFHIHDDRIIAVELPICLFRCQSLKSLMVDLKFSILKTPSLACSTTLESLKLKNLTIDEEFCKWISCSCKCLKELWLELVHGSQTITIESSSLESLHFSSCYFYYGSQYVGCDILYLSISGEKLEDIHLEWKAVSSNHLINIDAPKLKHFKWFGKLARLQNMRNSVCLEEAVFCLRARVHDIDKVMGILSSIRRVKALVINDDTTKALLFRREQDSVPELFHHLSHFRTYTRLSNFLVRRMACLLRGMYNLKTLDVKYVATFRPLLLRIVEVTVASGFSRRFWKSQNLACINQLEEVTIELSYGGNELEFARYIFEEAKNLKKMVVLYLPNQSTLMRTVNEREMNSATVVFKEKQRMPELCRFVLR